MNIKLWKFCPCTGQRKPKKKKKEKTQTYRYTLRLWNQVDLCVGSNFEDTSSVGNSHAVGY